ncbi:hypothetical protein [Agrobacterium radiobacter]|uniref:hypothetical protein n=1 Tax=Agrobacterium TaxID=357 RepID=UPI000ACBF3BC|nr:MULTISPECIES: hypothetical protein [Agrobacterium tumefaciens complex]
MAAPDRTETYFFHLQKRGRPHMAHFSVEKPAQFRVKTNKNGAIRIFRNGEPQKVIVKETLRSVAADIGVDLLNSKGGLKNTQQLGADVIRCLNAAAGLL